jgi:hypothetical protein
MKYANKDGSKWIIVDEIKESSLNRHMTRYYYLIIDKENNILLDNGTPKIETHVNEYGWDAYTKKNIELTGSADKFECKNGKILEKNEKIVYVNNDNIIFLFTKNPTTSPSRQWISIGDATNTDIDNLLQNYEKEVKSREEEDRKREEEDKKRQEEEEARIEAIYKKKEDARREKVKEERDKIDRQKNEIAIQTAKVEAENNKKRVMTIFKNSIASIVATADTLVGQDGNNYYFVKPMLETGYIRLTSDNYKQFMNNDNPKNGYKLYKVDMNRKGAVILNEIKNIDIPNDYTDSSEYFVKKISVISRFSSVFRRNPKGGRKTRRKYKSKL